MVDNVPTQAAALDPSSNPPPVAVPELGKHTALGFVWMLVQTIMTKGVGVIGQILTAKFLLPHDYHLVSLTFIVVSFPAMIRDAGLRAILVQRQKQLRRWITPVFWMSLALAAVSAAAMIGLAPLGARLFSEQRLIPLIIICALGAFPTALQTVPAALLQIHLNFRYQAVVSFVSSLLLQATCVLMAWRGYGPYSYIVANIVCAVVATLMYWIAFPCRIGLRPQFRRWRFLLPDSGTLLGCGLLWLAVSQGDNFFLGLFHKTDDALGIFFFAFNLSWQSFLLLTTNLGAVLFPAMSKLQNDPQRQMSAYLRAARMLALLGAPACLLQAAVASPAFHLVFSPQYWPAIHVMQALCVGMAFRCVGITAPNVNFARGRFQLQLLLHAIYCVTFLSTMAVAAKVGAALAVGAAEGGFYCIMDPIMVAVTLWLNGAHPRRDLRRIFAFPIALGAASAGAGWIASEALPSFPGDNVVRIAVAIAGTAAVYFPALRTLAPQDWKEILRIIRRA